MSLNVYRSRQVIEYAHDDEKTYHGFRVSWPGDSAEVYPFDTAEQRAAFVEHMRPALTDPDDDPQAFAAVVAVSLWGDEYQQGGADFYLTERWPDLEWFELAAAFRETEGL